MKSYSKIVVYSVLICATAAAQEKWDDYVGIYFIDSVDVQHFGDFYSFRLEPADYWKYLDTSRCSAQWWPNDNLYKDSCEEVNFQALYLQNDSIYFRTTKCHDEHYVFSGRFKMSATQFPDYSGSPVLEGVLLFYKDGQLRQRMRATFRYEDEGD